MLKHFVLMRYNDATTEAHISEFCQRMFALKSHIPDITELEIARDLLRDNRSWDLMLIMQFDSVECLRRYQKHSAHVTVMQFNDPLVKDIATFDYELPVEHKG